MEGVRSSSDRPEISGKPRKNTLEEKRRMRNLRKKKKRALKKGQGKSLQHDLEEAQEKCIKHEKDVALYKDMSRSYRDRWHWELLRRREAMKLLKRKEGSEGASNISVSSSVHEIGPDLLSDPMIEGKQAECFIGRGSFSVVRLQFYRGIKVAVKEFLPNTVKDDVLQEAALLSQLKHQYLPCFFGVVTSQRPYRVITQFQGIRNEAVTVRKEAYLHKIGIKCTKTWLLFCAQLFEALNHLHTKALILHNDIKSDNIIITEEGMSTERVVYYVVLIDFGKATKKADGRRFDLSESERREHLVKYRHIPPEVVGGEMKQNEKSDVYSAGRVIEFVHDHGFFSTLSKDGADRILNLITMCKSDSSTQRPTAEHCMHSLFKIAMTL